MNSEEEFPSNVLLEEDYAPVNVMILKDYYRNNLLQLIASFGKTNKKRLFCDRYCNWLRMFLIPNDKELTERGINNKILELNENTQSVLSPLLQTWEDELAVFLVQPKHELVDSIYACCLMLTGRVKSIHIIFVPGETYDYKQRKEGRSTQNCYYYNFPIDILPFDYDLLSLEDYSSFRDIYLENDYSSLISLAESTVKLESCFGRCKFHYAKGDLAEKFLNMIKEKEKEFDIGEGSRGNQEDTISVVAFDRNVDFPILMATNYTLEGAIDEVFGILYDKVQIEQGLLNENIESNEPKKSKLNSKHNDHKFLSKIILHDLSREKDPDNVYQNIKCMNIIQAQNTIIKWNKEFNKVSVNKIGINNLEDLNNNLEDLNKIQNKIDNYPKVSAYIRNLNLCNFFMTLRQDYRERQRLEQEQIMLSGFVPKRLSDLYDLLLSERKDIKEERDDKPVNNVEELKARLIKKKEITDKLYALYRLMILESVTQDGINNYKQLKKDIINIFGFQEVFTLRELEKVGFLKEKILFNKVKKLMDFKYSDIVEKFELINIHKTSYVTDGYCPMTLRLIEQILDGGWGKINDILKKIPGSLIYPPDERMVIEPPGGRSTIFVAFLGGVTYAEIEGIRYLNRILDLKYKHDSIRYGKRAKKIQFIILTNCIINHKKIISQFSQKIKTKLTIKKFYQDISQ